jgi:hypothetical protein
MYIVRVIFRTGTVLDFNFSDFGVAQRTIDAITERRCEGSDVKIMDEGGRDYRFSGADLLSEGLIDIARETAAVVRLGILINQAGAETKMREGVMDEPALPPPNALGSLLPDEGRTKRVPRFSA